MRPLEETFRAPAAALGTRSGSRQGGNEQVAGEPGAFESVVADAGRQKASAQGAIQDAGSDAVDALPDGAETAGTEFTIGNRKPSILIASAAVTGTGRLSTPSAPGHAQGDPNGALLEGQQSSELKVVRDKGNRQFSAASIAGEEAGDPEDKTATDSPKDHRLVETGAAESSGASDQMSNSNAASGAPANGPVSDLLTLLGGNAPEAMQIDSAGGEITDKTMRSAVDRTAGPAAEMSNILSDATAEDGSRTEQQGDAGSDRLFRLARADGKGQAVSMTISAGGEATAVENGNSSASARAETVTVLEARRYLGVAMNTNSAAVAGAIAGDGEWAQALQSSPLLAQPEASNHAGKTLNTLKIQMHPIELGTVTATLRLKDDELQVDLKVETGEAFRQLRDDQSEIVKALRAQGFAVDQVNVVFNAGGDASSGSGSHPQTQAQLGQSGGERTGGDSGQGRQQQDGGAAAQAETWWGNDGTDDASGGVEHSRAGDVYM
ncbi:flagellar hook-length control protein FliK [Sinorhizobium sp. CCBAU 05631]|uniref:flagellar hook-length control protein FliK n=1 Tax=Sinorhizobium sp. CCBAU 05631 TaxID=794846 RepID=UPI0004B9B312|nr:flagellar hook-length control protein FliK [Sinorhizobium sp. CCBAU 05631]ASY55295.1 Flagellar hook-length control protein FliK [Sinorhizobium sp. CCBAU 05631]